MIYIGACVSGIAASIICNTTGDIDILFCHREHINSEDLENSKKYF